MARATGLVAAAVLLLLPGMAIAQQAGNPNDPWCQEGSGGDRGRYCEVREMTLPPPGGALTVDAAPNGSIRVTGWNQREVRVRAKVTASGDTNEEAQALARGVTVQAGGTIRADGPSGQGNASWSVSYEVSIPFDQALSLSSVNGSIAIDNVRSQVDFKTQNGSISLTNVAGRIQGRTQNGSVRVTLDTPRWDGEGLDAQTNNGSISVTVPDGFAAHLETATVNGRVAIGFPVSLPADADPRRVTTDLNGGGAPMRLVTTNGSISIRKK
jgi:hypothetical protein